MNNYPLYIGLGFLAFLALSAGCLWMWTLKRPVMAVPFDVHSFDRVLTVNQILELAMFAGLVIDMSTLDEDELEAEVTVGEREHTLYAWMTEYPAEGAIPLDRLPSEDKMSDDVTETAPGDLTVSSNASLSDSVLVEGIDVTHITPVEIDVARASIEARDKALDDAIAALSEANTRDKAIAAIVALKSHQIPTLT